MGKYYCLIAGLPNITLDDSKIAYSVVEFREELQSILSRKDRSVVDLFFLKYDNKNILSYLEKKDQAEFDSRGNFSLETIDFLYKTLKEEGVLLSSKQYPSYFLTFLEQYISEEQGESNSGKRKIPWEDRLSALYYEYAMKCKNRFVSEWFELNLNVSNILTAIVCRKFGLEKENYIVGDNGVAEQLKMSNAQDFGMGNLLDYFSELQRLMEPQLAFFCKGMPFQVVFHPFDPKERAIIYDDRSITVETIPLKHRLPTCGFLFREKPLPNHILRDMIDFYNIPLCYINNIKCGADWITADGRTIKNEYLTTPADKPRSYAYCSDTKYMPRLYESLLGVDLLYHEATYCNCDEKRASLYYHSTAEQAATVALKANVGKLVLGHFSARYENEEILLKEAEKVFKNVELAREMAVFDI